MGGCYITQGAQLSAEGWGEGGDVCTHTAGSLCCRAETNRTF